MPAISHYHVLVYGSPDGYQTNRAQIALYSAPNQVAAFIRFNDPGMIFETDSQAGGIILMFLPSSMFQNILDILRNEKPISIYFSAGRAFFGTGQTEAVGEGE